PQNSRALAHLLDSHQITIVTIACAADHHIEVVLVVVEIRMFAAQIVFDSTSAQVWPGNRVRDRALFRDDADVFCAIDKNLVPGQQPVAFIETRSKVIEELFELRDKGFRKVADLPTHSRVRRGESRASQEFEQIVKFFALGERVEEN